MRNFFLTGFGLGLVMGLLSALVVGGSHVALGILSVVVGAQGLTMMVSTNVSRSIRSGIGRGPIGDSRCWCNSAPNFATGVIGVTVGAPSFPSPSATWARCLYRSL